MHVKYASRLEYRKSQAVTAIYTTKLCKKYCSAQSRNIPGCG